MVDMFVNSIGDEDWLKASNHPHHRSPSLRATGTCLVCFTRHKCAMTGCVLNKITLSFHSYEFIGVYMTYVARRTFAVTLRLFHPLHLFSRLLFRTPNIINYTGYKHMVHPPPLSADNPRSVYHQMWKIFKAVVNNISNICVIIRYTTPGKKFTFNPFVRLFSHCRLVVREKRVPGALFIHQ